MKIRFLVMFDKLRALLRRYFVDPHRPSDPLIGVRQPRSRGPGGRSSAVAVLEPDDDRNAVDATGKGRLARYRDAPLRYNRADVRPAGHLRRTGGVQPEQPAQSALNSSSYTSEWR